MRSIDAGAPRRPRIPFHGEGIVALSGCAARPVARFAWMMCSHPELQSPGSMDRMVSGAPMVRIAPSGQQQPVPNPARCEYTQSCIMNPLPQSQATLPQLDEYPQPTSTACPNLRRFPLLQRDLLQGGGMGPGRPHAGILKSIRPLHPPQLPQNAFLNRFGTC